MDVIRCAHLTVTGPLAEQVSALVAVEVPPEARERLCIVPHESFVVSVDCAPHLGRDPLDRRGECTMFRSIRDGASATDTGGHCLTLFGLLTPAGAIAMLDGQAPEGSGDGQRAVAGIVDRGVTVPLEVAIAAAPTLDDKLQRLGLWFEQRFDRHRRVDRGALRAARAAARIARDPQGSIEEVARLETVSRRQLERDIAVWLDTSPKRLAQAARLQQVARRGAGRHGLADVAFEAGFADQAHMTRSIRRMTGLTPLQFLRAGGSPVARAFRAATGGTVFL